MQLKNYYYFDIAGQNLPLLALEETSNDDVDGKINFIMIDKEVFQLPNSIKACILNWF